MLVKAPSSEDIQAETAWLLALKKNEFGTIRGLAKVYVGSGATSVRSGSISSTSHRMRGKKKTSRG